MYIQMYIKRLYLIHCILLYFIYFYKGIVLELATNLDRFLLGHGTKRYHLGTHKFKVEHWASGGQRGVLRVVIPASC